MDPESKNRNWSKLLDRTPEEFSEEFDRVEARVSAKALHASYEAIRELVPGQAVLPMVKADAYGHGAREVVRILARAPELYGFGVATLEEGREVREALGAKGRKTRVLVLSGTANWTEEKGQYCERFGLTPTIVSEEDWKRFLKAKWPERLKYHLKFNTGMNRLGISPGHLSQVVSQLKDKPGDWRPEGVATHFATAEDPEHALTRRQLESFKSITGAVKSIWTDTLFHCANSASIWNARKFGLEGWTDIVRPGISLYGVPPWAGAPIRGLVPAMELRYAVLQRRLLKPAESIGYGAQFRLKGSDPALEVAILGAGYADGFHRMNSSQGAVLLGGKMRRVLGVVSMDLSAIECDASTKPGDWARILGDGLDPWTQAKAAGTIPYELLTSVSRRVRRVYD
jgi:alanine racemase